MEDLQAAALRAVNSDRGNCSSLGNLLCLHRTPCFALVSSVALLFNIDVNANRNFSSGSDSIYLAFDKMHSQQGCFQSWLPVVWCQQQTEKQQKKNIHHHHRLTHQQNQEQASRQTRAASASDGQAIEWNEIDRQTLEWKAYRGWTRAMLMAIADTRIAQAYEAEADWTVHEHEHWTWKSRSETSARKSSPSQRALDGCHLRDKSVSGCCQFGTQANLTAAVAVNGVMGNTRQSNLPLESIPAKRTAANAETASSLPASLRLAALSACPEWSNTKFMVVFSAVRPEKKSSPGQTHWAHESRGT